MLYKQVYIFGLKNVSIHFIQWKQGSWRTSKPGMLNKNIANTQRTFLLDGMLWQYKLSEILISKNMKSLLKKYIVRRKVWTTFIRGIYLNIIFNETKTFLPSAANDK